MQTFSESEKSIEQYLVKAVHTRHGLCLKFVSPGHTGVPDRVIILESIIYFAEIKAPGGRLSASQQAMHRKLRAAGARVVTLYSREEVDKFIHEIYCSMSVIEKSFSLIVDLVILPTLIGNNIT